MREGGRSENGSEVREGGGIGSEVRKEGVSGNEVREGGGSGSEVREEGVGVK